MPDFILDNKIIHMNGIIHAMACPFSLSTADLTDMRDYCLARASEVDMTDDSQTHHKPVFEALAAFYAEELRQSIEYVNAKQQS